MSDTTSNVLSKIANIKEVTLTRILYTIIGFIMAVIIGYFLYYTGLRRRECKKMSTIYGEVNGKIRSAATDSNSNTYGLRDYYIKSAYNVCAGGNYRMDYVDTCHLKTALLMGCRGLDMEIFSVNDSPVVACSTTDSKYVKETFNFIHFDEVMNILRDNAFRSSTAPNFDDPIILHLRIKSGNTKMYDKMAAILEHYNDLLMDKEYSFEYGGKNLGEVPLSTFRKKIVIAVDRSNPAFLESDAFYEYVNITSNSVFMRALHSYDVKYAPDIAELIEFNERGITIAMPDRGSNPVNPSGNIMRETGCHLQAMRYSYLDTNVEENDIFFDEAGFAFVLKPEKLRYQPILVEAPEEQKPELSYETRDVSADYYQFDI